MPRGDEAKVPQESVGHVRQRRGCCCVPSAPPNLMVQGKDLCSEVCWQFWNALSYVKSLSSLAVADNKPHLAAASLKAGQAVSQGRQLLTRKGNSPERLGARAVALLCTELGL